MTVLFAGSFDPFTIGHQDIVERAVHLFGDVVIGIGYNEHKPGEWSVAQRLHAIKNLYEGNSHVRVEAYSGLTSIFLKEIGANALLRGVRSIQDFEYERNMAEANRNVFGVDTVFLVSDPKYSFVSSSLVRELMHNGFDPSRYIAGDFQLDERISKK